MRAKIASSLRTIESKRLDKQNCLVHHLRQFLANETKMQPIIASASQSDANIVFTNKSNYLCSVFSSTVPIMHPNETSMKLFH